MDKFRKAIKTALKESRESHRIFQERDIETNEEHIYQGWVEALEWVLLLLKTEK